MTGRSNCTAHLVLHLPARGTRSGRLGTAIVWLIFAMCERTAHDIFEKFLPLYWFVCRPFDV
jgi:hypothetical protein